MIIIELQSRDGSMKSTQTRLVGIINPIMYITSLHVPFDFMSIRYTILFTLRDTATYIVNRKFVRQKI